MMTAGAGDAPQRVDEGSLVVAPWVQTADFQAILSEDDKSCRLEYSTHDGKLSLRLVPISVSADTTCEITLFGFKKVMRDGESVPDPDGESITFSIHPGSTISAE